MYHVIAISALLYSIWYIHVFLQLVKHMVNGLPFPFKSAEEYERQLQKPLGKEWNPTGIHKRLIQPKVLVIV